MKAGYLVLAGRIRQELEDLERAISRAERAIRTAARAAEDSDLYVDAAALNLHDFYTGLERIFRQIATTVDASVPSSPEWHRELLQQMCIEIPNVRPRALSPETCKALDEFMRFRHVVRNIYAFRLDAERISLLVPDARLLMGRITNELKAFALFLEGVG